MKTFKIELKVTSLEGYTIEAEDAEHAVQALWVLGVEADYDEVVDSEVVSIAEEGRPQEVV